MPIAPVRNAYLHYALDGPERAPVLVLSNSLGTDFHLWDPQIAGLRTHFRVLRYDTRGHGGSTGRPEDYSLDDLGGDVIELMNFLSIDRAHVCGVSLGGITALWLAIHAPERVTRLMACNTAAKIGNDEMWNARIEQIKAGGMASIADVTMERWFTAPFRARARVQVEAIRQGLLHTHAPGYTACCAALRNADLRPMLSAIKAPTLVISGACDPATPPVEGQYIAQHIAGAKYIELQTAHLANIEQPDSFLDAMLSFLS